MIDGQPLSYVASMDPQKNYSMPEHYKGMYAPQNDLMTLEVEDPILDHFIFILLDNVIVYEHQVGLVTVEVSGEIHQLTEKELRFVEVDFL